MSDHLGLKQLIDQPTRITRKTESILGHLFLSNDENISSIKIPEIITRKSGYRNKRRHITIKYGNSTKIDDEIFISDISKVPWSILDH